MPRTVFTRASSLLFPLSFLRSLLMCISRLRSNGLNLRPRTFSTSSSRVTTLPGERSSASGALVLPLPLRRDLSLVMACQGQAAASSAQIGAGRMNNSVQCLTNPASGGTAAFRTGTSSDDPRRDATSINGIKCPCASNSLRRLSIALKPT